MSVNPLAKRFRDKLGQTHEMVSEDHFYWSYCRQHNNALTEALGGLPGVQISCQTGHGWQGDTLIRVGWPIWVAKIGYRRTLEIPNCPASVINYVAERVESGEAYLVMQHRNATAGAKAKVVSRYPRLKPKEESEELVLGVLSMQELEQALASDTLDSQTLAEFDWQTLSADFVLSLVKKYPGIKYGLARSEGAPTRVLAGLADDAEFEGVVAHNPSATAEILDHIIATNPALDTLSAVVYNANVSVVGLAGLTQHHSLFLRRAAAERLAARAAQVEAVEANGGLEVTL